MASGGETAGVQVAGLSQSTTELEQLQARPLVPEVADMEEMLKELDACGVSCTVVVVTTTMDDSYYYS